MSDQVYEPYYLTRSNRVQCKNCTWEGEVLECRVVERSPGDPGDTLICGSDNYHCPTCNAILAILSMGGFHPTTLAIVTLPSGVNEEYIHTTP